MSSWARFNTWIWVRTANMVTFKLPSIQQHKERNQYLQISLSGLDDKGMLRKYIAFPCWYASHSHTSFFAFSKHRCKDAGQIFADPIVKRAAEELFVPCAFNTWDRHNPRLNQPMRRWGAGLANSWWGYLRIVDPEGKLVIGGTKQITSHRCIEEVKQCMRDTLEDLEEEIPSWFE